MGKLRLKPGDEVITVAAGSTSLASAISQNGLVPVYIDMALPAFNADVRQFQAAISSRTRAIALAHIGGNPFDLDAVTMLAAFNNLLLIEDCREAAGAAFGGRPVGCFGQFATASFQSGRQIAAGGGGAVMASSPLYRSIAEGLAQSHPAREVHAAMGIALASAFASTREERNQNAAQLSQGLSGLGDFFLLPDRLRGAQPSWIELPVLVRERAPFDRARLLAALREAGIAVRAFTSFPRIAHRKVGSLPVTQLVNERGLLVRVPPAPGQADAATIVEAFHEAVSDLR
jgi:CDP-6-deoxy-D-xylo-4-hexulose-3-dehydrase